MRGVHYPRTFSTDLINCTCKISGQETLVVNGGEIRPRRCSGPWPMPVIDILTTREYSSWNSTRSVQPDSTFPSVLPSSGLPHGV